MLPVQPNPSRQRLRRDGAKAAGEIPAMHPCMRVEWITTSSEEFSRDYDDKKGRYRSMAELAYRVEEEWKGVFTHLRIEL